MKIITALAPVAVTYRDGLSLTFLFPRSTRVVDLMTQVARAGQVRKVTVGGRR